MTRAAHPPALVARAKALREQGQSYERIRAALWSEFGLDVGASTVRDWVTSRTRGA